MSNSKQKLQPEDRAITTLECLRGQLVRAIAEIDREIKYQEKAKKARKK